MGLETADYISELNAGFPLDTDQVQEADDHMRLIKKCVQQSFPNVDAAVTASADDLNTLAGASGPIDAGRKAASFAINDQILLVGGSGTIPPGFVLVDTAPDFTFVSVADVADLGTSGGTWDLTTDLYTAVVGDTPGNSFNATSGASEVPSMAHQHYLESTNTWRPRHLKSVIIKRQDP